MICYVGKTNSNRSSGGNSGSRPSCIATPVGLLLENTMKKIPLTRGQFALVDDEDFGWLNQWHWCAHRNRNPNGNLYAVGKLGSMHRVIMKAKPKQILDHKNRNSLDNRRINLRFCTFSQNHQNKISKRKSTSKYKGVSWFKPTKKWCVHICLKRDKCIGYFDNEADAAKAYDKKAIELFGEFALLNFPNEVTNE